MGFKSIFLLQKTNTIFIGIKSNYVSFYKAISPKIDIIFFINLFLAFIFHFIYYAKYPCKHRL